MPCPRGEAESAGLPPALITCAEIDPFRDEAVDYALRLLRAGVSTELHVFARTCHGFDSLLPDWSVSERLFALQGHALAQRLRRAGRRTFASTVSVRAGGRICCHEDHRRSRSYRSRRSSIESRSAS